MSTDEAGEWEVIRRPWLTHGDGTVHATVARPGDPGTKRDKSWGAQERIAIKRAE